MTVLLTSMPLPVREQASETGVHSVNQAKPDFPSDADACRIATGVGRGDEKAFRELYDLYQRRLLRFSLLLLRGDELQARETIQTVFLTAASRLRRVESEAHLWNWLARIARQHIGKAWRQQARDSGAISVADLPEPPAPPAPDTELEQRLDAALLQMESDDRTLLEWFYFDDLSHKEIARRLSVTPKAVSSRLERARARLRLLLDQNERISNEA